jgi:hypothetical protein
MAAERQDRFPGWFEKSELSDCATCGEQRRVTTEGGNTYCLECQRVVVGDGGDRTNRERGA